MVKTRTSGSSRIAILSVSATIVMVAMLVMSPLRASAAAKTFPLTNNPGNVTACQSNEWHFVINQLDDGFTQAPAFITVFWSDGTSSQVGQTNVGQHEAGYTDFGHTGLTVVGAEAVLYEGWSGQFVLSHIPCNEVTPTPEIPTETPTQDIPTETPTEVATDTPTATGTVGGGGEETPTNTPTVEVTETVGGEEETPVPSSTATTAPSNPTETAEPVDELPNTGTNPGSTGTSGLLAAALLAVVLAGTGLLLRRRSVSAGR